MAFEVQYGSANQVVPLPTKDGEAADTDINGTPPDDVALLFWDDTNDMLVVRKPDGTYITTVALT